MRCSCLAATECEPLAGLPQREDYFPLGFSLGAWPWDHGTCQKPFVSVFILVFGGTMRWPRFLCIGSVFVPSLSFGIVPIRNSPKMWFSRGVAEPLSRSALQATCMIWCRSKLARTSQHLVHMEDMKILQPFAGNSDTVVLIKVLYTKLRVNSKTWGHDFCAQVINPIPDIPGPWFSHQNSWCLWHVHPFPTPNLCGNIPVLDTPSKHTTELRAAWCGCAFSVSHYT